MATVTRITSVISTHNAPGSGTDGYVFLGMGGREFRLDTSADDYERGDSEDYFLGSGANVRFPDRNDPRQPLVLDTNNLDDFPVYIRFEPESGGDHWRLRSVAILVYTGELQFFSAYLVELSRGLLLGRSAGEALHVPKIFESEAAVLATIERHRTSPSADATD